jgi:hypothetical protein
MYHDANGNPVTLLTLCRAEPDWAANMIFSLKECRKQLEEKLGKLKYIITWMQKNI